MATVFFYGLFMDEQLLQSKGMSPTLPRLVKVQGYGLRIGERATLEPSDTEHVYGAVMELDDAALATLYSEKSVADYVPVSVVATDEQQQSIPAICYILPMVQVRGSNSDYARSLGKVAQKLGLPIDYINEIRTWI